MPRHGSVEPGADVESVPDAPRRSSIAGWSIRRKLTLLVTIPLVVLLVGGGVLVASLAGTYQKAHTARLDAELMEPSLRLSRVLFNEFGMPGANTDADKLAKLREETDDEIAAIKPKLEDLSERGSSSDSSLPTTASTMLNQLDRIDDIRKLVDSLLDNKELTGTSGVNQVTTAAENLFNAARDLPEELATDLGVTSGNHETVTSSSLFTSVSQMGFAAAEEITVFSNAFTGQVVVDVNAVRNLESLVAQQELGLSSAQSVAFTEDQRNQLIALSNQTPSMSRWRSALEGQIGKTKTSNFGDSSAFAELASSRLADIEETATAAGRTTLKSAQDAETAALFRVALVAAAVIVTILVVSALLTTIARTVTAPLRRLRAGAVEVASVQLPAAVARIEQDGVGADIALPPVLPADFNPGPETLEVAHAVDDLGAEAVRLATAQVRLRRALDEAFVSMSRRSQSMVEKQLAIIDSLESQEQDPDQLRNLFRLDHLAARMRRYNDNLLVLAGSAVRTRATAPVKIAELFRAATSEMEQYERVRLQPVSGASIAGTVAGELVHLLAELLDNAAMYSPPSSAIVLSAAFTADGGLQIEVLDAGVGISPGELDRLNARLTQPEAIDTQVPSRMGLFVVARLARRGTFGVQLQARPDASGTIALVRVPASLVIGAPGSTGETPTGVNPQVRPLTPAAGQSQLPQGPVQGGGYSSFGEMSQPLPQRELPQTPSPAAAAAGVAAQAAAGVRSVADEVEAELPRRRRTPGSTGMPAEATAAIGEPGSTGLFTPNVPAAQAETAERGQGTGRSAVQQEQPAAFGFGQQHDEQPAAFGFAQQAQPAALEQEPAAFDFSQQEPHQGYSRPEPQAPRANQFVSPPPETTPGGIPNLPTRRPGEHKAQMPGSFGPQNGPSMFGQTDQDFAPSQRQGFESRQTPARPSGYEAGDSTPAAGISGLPGLVRRPAGNGPATGSLPVRGPATGSLPVNDPLSAPTGSFRAAPNPALPAGESTSDWQDPELSNEITARATAAAAYRPTDSQPLIGDSRPDFNDPTPIFDQISVWFSSEPAQAAPSISVENGDQRIIDLRDHERERSKQSSRWAALGDQRWLATNARASAAPETDGRSDAGLPTRRPGANLLPSTAGAVTDTPAARPRPSKPSQPADATVVRGRLGSYQRGLANARKARAQADPAPAFNPVGASLFTTNSDGGADNGSSAEQGGDQ
ncbi:hypothetical protein KIH74_00370 [Kineosporia sp. J2-2]|uniref:histidine kinase n=1 Tax=Kineosporia corallincola TaxID=2835133 RepID=A0ABS5TB41_9ACTN|nr:ATP-binding protein [Kineosporia corallincola]MBT0767353.1 hypothetical protein [Kineosporia corallincola]